MRTLLIILASICFSYAQVPVEKREQVIEPKIVRIKDNKAYIPQKASLENSVKTRNTPSKYPWKKNIVSTVFWIGEKPTTNNPVPNDKSSWDVNWQENFGGYDSPTSRCEQTFKPVGVSPRQNPFYVALPYNDISPSGTKQEAPLVIPWFASAFERCGKSVLKGRWVVIHKDGRFCFAQWEDVGPFRTDHWQYVFGDERPSKNRNKNAGIDVSPAVRDYLGLSGMDVVDWRFVEFYEVGDGPWKKYGDNNIFAKMSPEELRSLIKKRGTPTSNIE